MKRKIHNRQEEVDELIEKAIKADKRLAGKRLEQAVWKVHAYARANCGSLDSERHCNMIQTIIEAAVETEQEKRDEAIRVARLENEKCKELRKALKEIKWATSGEWYWVDVGPSCEEEPENPNVHAFVKAWIPNKEADDG